jgi:hypothetical protein
MIKIYNKKKGAEIIMDESHARIIFEPHDYEDLPYVKISWKNIDWFRHKEKCTDCKLFYNDFGTSNYGWEIEYLNSKARLDLSEFGPKNDANTASRNEGEYFSGTILKLNLDTDSIVEMKVLLKVNELLEDDEKCCFFRDKIREFK